MEIGIDIENNSRFKNMEERKLAQIFSENEIIYAKKFINYYEHLCAFWCIKEAFVKATKNTKIEFTKIETSHNDDGSPFIVINKEILETLNHIDCKNIKISLSHSKEYSTAVCLIY